MDYNEKFHESLDLALDRYSVYVSNESNSETARECMSLRHRVFCVDEGFEPLSIDGLESDEFDSLSWHILLVDKLKGIACGTARLVMGKVPCETHISLGNPEHPNNVFDKTNAELSRMIIKKEYRGQSAPLLVLLLMSTYWGNRQNVKSVYCSMENLWKRKLSRIDGMTVRSITDTFDFKGKRQVCVVGGDKLIRDRLFYAGVESQSKDELFEKNIVETGSPNIKHLEVA